MRKFPFLRRPGKLILYALLMALLCSAALLFAWQYTLDGIAMEHSVDTYAYVGTLVESGAEPNDLAQIPEELVQALQESSHVSFVDSRRTQAALGGEFHRIHSNSTGMLQAAPDDVLAGGELVFMEAIIMEVETENLEVPPYSYDYCGMKVVKVWNDPSFNYDTSRLYYSRLASEAPLEVGQRVFIIDVSDSGQSLRVDSPAYVEELMGPGVLKEGFTPAMAENALTVIPEDADSEAYITRMLEETGLMAELEWHLLSKNGLTVRRTVDLNMVPYCARDFIRVYEGRTLNARDAGKNVCMISNLLSQKNRLSVGDTIQIQLAQDCYAKENGHEVGTPQYDSQLLHYGDFETYEIVGIYSQIGREDDKENVFYFGANDVLLPSGAGDSAAIPRCYSLSFRVPGTDYVEFMEEFPPLAAQYGFSLDMIDSGWDDVKDGFYAMRSRRMLMLGCAAAAFLAAILSFCVLLNAHCRYEYGLRRLMGATRTEASGIYFACFCFAGIPAGAISVLAAWSLYVHRLRPAMDGVLMPLLPSDSACALNLSAWAGLVLCAALAVLCGLMAYQERRGLLKLVRR